MYLIFLVFTLFKLVAGENSVYYLNEYARMPPKFHMDRYEPCIDMENGEYCTVNFHLVADQSKRSIEMYDLIKNYSKVETHFNLLRPRYGICLTKTCKKFYQRNASEDRSVILEASLNESLWEEYALRAKVSSDVTCHTKHTKIEFDKYDAIVATILLIILVLNVVGSFQLSRPEEQGKTFLHCFSIPRNWHDLTAPDDKRQNLFKGFDGIRSMAAIIVILCHNIIQFSILIDNSHYLEQVFHTQLYAILAVYFSHNVQIYFIISGLLRAYNMLIEQEKQEATRDLLPKSIIRKWLRISPSYFVTIAISATLLRHAGSGPVWQIEWDSQITNCRKYWWLNVLYINNYDDHVLNYEELDIAPNCLLQTWHIAVDFHLYVVGVVCMLVAASRRRLVLATLLVAGVLLPAAHTYFQDLEPFVTWTPKFVDDGVKSNLTFRNTYRKSHNNLTSYVIGLILGIIIYRWQKKQYYFSNYWNERLLKRMTLSSLSLLILWGIYFIKNEFCVRKLSKVIFAGVSRIIYGSAAGFLIIGIVVKGFYRNFLESNFWRIPSRVSYSVYLIHFAVIRLIASNRTHLIHMSFLHMAETGISCVVISFLAAIIFYLVIEAPFQKLIKYFFRKPLKKSTSKNKRKEN